MRAIMVAGFRPQKDHETLLRAMPLLPADTELWLVGDGATRTKMEALAVTLGITDRVKFLGWHDDVSALLSQCDIAVLSTHYEGMPMFLVEAMAAGLPIVATDIDAIRETVGDATLLVPPQAPEAMADAIRSLISDPALRTELAERARARAALFSIDTTARRYARLYLGVLGM